MIVKLLFSAALALGAGTLACGASAAPSVTGTWAISSSTVPGTVHLDVRLESDDGHSTASHSSDVDPRSIGLSAEQLSSPGHHVTFALVRDAGTMSCDGWLANGRGGGSVTFRPSAAYVAKMNERGYDPSDSQLATAAMLDLSIAYVDEMAAAGYAHVGFEKLAAFRALGIDSAYARSMRELSGAAEIDPDQLVSLRALRVDVGYLDDLAAVGYAHLSPRQLVEMRALKIDADYIRRVKAHGFAHPSVEDLVRMKAMKVI